MVLTLHAFFLPNVDVEFSKLYYKETKIIHTFKRYKMNQTWLIKYALVQDEDNCLERPWILTSFILIYSSVCNELNCSYSLKKNTFFLKKTQGQPVIITQLCIFWCESIVPGAQESVVYFKNVLDQFSKISSNKSIPPPPLSSGNIQYLFMNIEAWPHLVNSLFPYSVRVLRPRGMR